MPERPKAPPRPTHIAIFTRFLKSTRSRLEALVAFGVFTESERDGGFDTDESYGKNIEKLYDSNRDFCLNEARKALLDAATAAIEEKKTEIAKAHKGFRGFGVWEAFLGAFFWSVFLIVAGVLISFYKPELLEILRHVIERLQQVQPRQ